MKKKLALILALALCVSLLSGCTGGGTGEVETKPVGSSSVESKPAATPPAADEPTATTPTTTEPTAKDPQVPDTSETVPTVKEYIVPSVLGRTIEELEANSVILGDFMLAVDSTVFSEDYKEGQICEQTPKAGSMVREGELVITVKISGGPPQMTDVPTVMPSPSGTLKITVPNLVNLTLEDVARQITSVGLTLGTVNYFNNEEYPEGRVFWQSITPYTEVDKGSVIDLWVSKGPLEAGPGALRGFTTNIRGDDFTLSAGDSLQLKLTFDPADWSGEVTYSISDTRYATVSANGNVVNVNPDSTLHKVVLTITAGGITKEMPVYCRGVSDTEPGGVTVGKIGVIVNADSGLNVRSGPGTSYDKIASLFNGDTVTVLEDAGNGWYKISYAGAGGAVAEGYIIGGYISID